LIKPGPQFKKLINFLEPAVQKASIDPDYPKQLKLYLKEGNFADCEEDIYHIPVGEWPVDPSKF
jgi:hypothetical protein